MSKPRIHTLIMIAALLALAASPALAVYSLVWSDEFDGASLDTSNWTIDIGDGCPDLCGWGNNELQYYRAENVQVFGGNLILTARQESYGGRAFTSGKVLTRDKRTFLYGRIEMRAQIPTGGGMWPAFWMMPQDDAYGGWAASGEIDIMEAANDGTTIGGTIHYGGSWPNNTHSGGTYSQGGTSFGDDFHVYAIEWEPDEIRWYVDGVHYYTRTSSMWYSDGAPGNPRAPFDQDFFIILNAAVGGWYPGCTNPSCITADLPQQYLIDYVRVYQETGNEAPMVTITSPTEADNPPPGDILILADVSDSDGSVDLVEFYEGETLLGTDTNEPYGWLWPSVVDGCYAITARVVDDEGAEAFDTLDLVVGAGCGQEAYPGPTPLLPAPIQAENYDVGGESVAYHDTSPGNEGNQYRTDEDVDIETCSDAGGGYNVGWLAPGEWLEYTLEAPEDGTYPIDIRVASLDDGGLFRLEFDGVDLTGEVTVPVTGGWQYWTTISTSANLSAGVHVMRFVMIEGEFNINRYDFDEATVDAPPSVAVGPVLHPARPNPFNPATTLAFELPQATRASLVIHDVAGRRVKTLLSGDALGPGRHEATWDGRDESGRIMPAGVYFGRLVAGGETRVVRMSMIK